MSSMTLDQIHEAIKHLPKPKNYRPWEWIEWSFHPGGVFDRAVIRPSVVSRFVGVVDRQTRKMGTAAVQLSLDELGKPYTRKLVREKINVALASLRDRFPDVVPVEVVEWDKTHEV